MSSEESGSGSAWDCICQLYKDTSYRKGKCESSLLQVSQYIVAIFHDKNIKMRNSNNKRFDAT